MHTVTYVQTRIARFVLGATLECRQKLGKCEWEG